MITPMQFKQRIYAARRKRVEQDFYAWQSDFIKRQAALDAAALDAAARDQVGAFNGRVEAYQRMSGDYR